VPAGAKVPACPRPARLAAAAGPRRFAGCCLRFPVRGMPAQAPVYLLPCGLWPAGLVTFAPAGARARRRTLEVNGKQKGEG